MWHGEGLVLDDWPTDWNDARIKAGLTWEPVEEFGYRIRELAAYTECRLCGVAIGLNHSDECAYRPDGLDLVVAQDECTPLGALPLLDGRLAVPLNEHKVIVRPDRDIVLGVRSDEYSLIYHGEEHAKANNGASMEEIMEAFRNADGSLKFETAGSAKDGRAVWALLYLDEPYTTAGDDSETLPFLSLLNHHGIGGSCTACATQVRVVCWNTYQMALNDGERTGRTFTFRHTGDVAERIEEAKAAIAGLRDEAKAYQEFAADLMELNMDDERVAMFVSEFLPSPRENGEVISDRVQDNITKARSMFNHLYLDSVTTEGIRGTGWGVLQAATEYLDHSRAFRSRDSYLGRSILKGEPRKAVALNIIRSLA
jgi:phage/plasmid-like protein (TIGR03299 family)